MIEPVIPTYEVRKQEATPVMTLERFVRWFLHQPIGMLAASTVGPVFANGAATTTVLCRHRTFQVELVLVPQNAKWPSDHRHPNVNSIEVELFAPNEFGFGFTKNGKVFEKPDFLIEVAFSGMQHFCKCGRIGPDEFHSVVPSPKGYVILSFQEWLNGVSPTSVGLDWLGLPVNEEHAKQHEVHGNSAK